METILLGQRQQVLVFTVGRMWLKALFYRDRDVFVFTLSVKLVGCK